MYNFFPFTVYYNNFFKKLTFLGSESMFKKFLTTNDYHLLLDYTTNSAANKLAVHLQEMLPTNPKIPVVIACIGTDRSTGDSLGPLVGTLLNEKKLPFNYFVYGTLSEPIHALNLEEKINTIRELHGQAFIIAIDASLGSLKNVGHIKIGKGPLKPGTGVNKQLPEIGTIHITGTVNISGFMEYLILQNTRLHTVMEMAKVIVNAIYYSSNQKFNVKEGYFINGQP